MGKDMSEKKIFNVSIFGKNYSFASDDNEEDIYRAVHLVDTLLREINTQAKCNNEGKIAVLAALKFATDVVKGQVETEVQQAKLSEITALLGYEAPSNS